LVEERILRCAQDDGLANAATGLAISTRCGSEKFIFNEKPEKSLREISANTSGYVFDWNR
jgi:hypothetical protein